MGAGAARWQRTLLWGGMLEPAGPGRRTVRDWVVDAAIFAFAACSGAFVLAQTWDAHSTAVAILDVALGAVACLALWFRRARPLAVARIAVPLSAVSALAAMATLPGVFNAAIRLPLKQLAGVTALAAAGTAILPLLYPEVDGRGYGWQLSVGVLLTAVALGWGLFVRAQRELLRGLRARAEDEAREAERRRIAREMHDVLAHRLTILSVHAGALEHARSMLPAEYRETAGVIRDSAKLALEELRAVIGLLREHRPGAVPEPPQPTLEQVPALVEESRSAGMLIRYEERIGAAVPLAVGRTAYRAVQEGLTNARKHATGVPVELTIAGGPPLVVELVTRGARAANGVPGSGTGLIGLAERVELAGGDVSFGPDPDVVSPVRVLLVDDDPLLRSGLKLMLAPEESIEVIAEAGDGDEVLAAVDRHRPDAVLMDPRERDVAIAIGRGGAKRGHRARAAHQRRHGEVPHHRAALEARGRQPRADRAAGAGGRDYSLSSHQSAPITAPGGAEIHSHHGLLMSPPITHTSVQIVKRTSVSAAHAIVAMRSAKGLVGVGI